MEHGILDVIITQELILEKLGTGYNSTDFVPFHSFFKFKTISKLNENFFTYIRTSYDQHIINISVNHPWSHFYNFFLNLGL